MGILLLAAAPAHAGALDGLGAAPTCAALQLSAEQASCDAGGCTLQGTARLQCGALVLRAERLFVARTAEGRFAGAHAQGDVRLREGQRRLRCAALALGADRLQGRIDAATLEVLRDAPPERRAPADAADADADAERDSGPEAADDDAGASPERRAALAADADADRADAERRRGLVVRGSVQREADGTWRIWDARLTLCDCGPGCRPSWRLDAPEVRMRPGGRVLVLWPQVRINLLGLALVPITPPLLPISLPQAPRALGLLPPQVRFLGPQRPTLDVPLFVPLGPSWDVTLTPGARGDWGWAPRLAARLRGHPTEDVQLELDVSSTWDLRRGAAARLLGRGPRPAPGSVAEALLLQRERLLWRTAVAYRHTIALWPAPPATPLQPSRTDLRWLTEAAWASDDAVLADLGVAPGERVATYLPARTLLVLRRPALVVQLGAEHLVQLDNVATAADGGAYPHLSNTDAQALRTLQRLPHAAVATRVAGLPGRLQLDGALALERYAPLQRPPPAAALGASGGGRPGQALVHGVVGLGRAAPLGPWRTHVRAALDAMALQQDGSYGPGTLQRPPLSMLDAALRTEAGIEATLARRFGDVRHTLTPGLRYRGLMPLGHLGALRPDGPIQAPQAADAAPLDPWLPRVPLQQLQLELRQRLAGPAGEGSLTLTQPLALSSGRPLQPSLQGRWAGPRGPQLAGRVTLAYAQRGGRAWREVQAELAQGVGPLALSASYLRVAPNAERLVRSAYALAADGQASSGLGGRLWAHMLQLGAGVQAGAGLTARYTLGLQLPRPEAPAGFVEPACPAGQRGCAASQGLVLGYRSPCECWGIEASMAAAPHALAQTWRMQVLLTVADARVGS